jgi:rsbT co-antagonist protein RsbR
VSTMVERTRSVEVNDDTQRVDLERLRKKNGAGLGEQTAREERLTLLEGVLSKTAALVYVFDYEKGHNAFANRDLANFLGYPGDDEIRAMGDRLLPAIMHPEDTPRIPEMIGRIMTAADDDVVVLEYRLRDHSGAYRWVEDRLVVFSRNPDGSVRQHLGTLQDITERKRIAEERNALQAQIIAAQAATIRDLSSPLLPIADQVVVMPLVGAIDEQRGRQIIEDLLAGIERNRAKAAILDITGVRLVDVHVAQMLVHAANAAGMLGARVVLTGVSPAIAQTLVDLGIELGNLTTLATLQTGIGWAIRRRY